MKKLTKIKDLQIMADIIREDTLSALTAAKSGHSGGPLGMADIFTALYFNVLKHHPKNPQWEGRDRLVLSNGHICPVMYAAMANAGYFPKTELLTLRKLGTRLQGHPHREALPGLETTSGPLGSGLSQAIGMAYGLRLDKKKNLVWCICSDGEHDEGNTWEAAMCAGKNKLRNLIAVIDRNNIQIDGNTEEVLALEPLADKLRAFNFHVIEINGHSMSHVIEAFEEAKSVYERPTAIICHTVPGKGVSFMERDFEWHGKAPTPEQAKVALIELEHEHEAILAEK